jgi:hypothetical protein
MENRVAHKWPCHPGLTFLKSLYFLGYHFRQGYGIPGMIDGYKGDAPLGSQPGLRRAVKLKLKNNGFFLDFLDRGGHFKQITLESRYKKAAIRRDFGHAEFFFLVAEKCFR